MDYTLKLMFVGDDGVGKTCLTTTISTNKFPLDYLPTMFDVLTKEVEVNGNKVQFALWDTAGSPEYNQLRPLSYPETDIFIICYSPTTRNSFESITRSWIPEIQLNCPDVPFVILATKIDLRDDEEILNLLKEKNTTIVTFDEGRKLAIDNNASGYYECSASTYKGIHSLMEDCARIIISHNNNNTQSSKCIIN